MNRKTRIMALSAALAGVMTAGGMAAYFTDADTQTNTFTVGKISLDLQEPGWDAANAVNVTPNQVISKDPQIKNDGINTEFVFMEVTVPYANVETAADNGVRIPAADTELFYYTVNSGWTEIGMEKDTESMTVTHRYVYGTETSCTELAAGTVTPSLFDTVTVANVIEDQNLEETTQNILVHAYGIQSEHIGADDKTAPDEVWSVIANQAPSKEKPAEDANTDIIS